MATRFPSNNSSLEDSNSESFLDISVVGNKHQKVSFENVSPNHPADPTPIEEWEFIPTGFVPNSKTLIQQDTSSKIATLPKDKSNTFFRKPNLRKRLTLSKLMNPKRSAPETSFNTYDIVDPYEAPSTELVEQELTQCLLHESVLIDECPSDNEDDVIANSVDQYTLSSKRRDSVGECFLARSNVKWQRAVNSLKRTVEDDQQICGVWLLSEINHWDNESERIVMLLEDSLLIAKYNFYKRVLLEVRSIGLSGIYAITHGPFATPSLFKKRPGIGVRLHWNKDIPLSKAQKWNPWSEKIPFTTFGPHPSTYSTVQCSTEGHLSIYSFLQKLKDCLKAYVIENDTEMLFDAVDSLVTHSSKLGIIQQIHNKAKLGCDLTNSNSSS